MNRISAVIVAGAGLLGAFANAQATDCLLRVGVHDVDPKSNNNPVVKVKSAASLSIDGSCFVTDNIAIDVLGALPFKHDIDLAASGVKVASTEHLPPTVDVQYHFLPKSPFDVYVGAGLNYTFFFSKNTTGPLAGTNLSLGSSFGVAAQVGADVALGKDWLLGLDLRWAKISTAAKVNGGSIGDVDIDPIVYGVTIGRRFSL